MKWLLAAAAALMLAGSGGALADIPPPPEQAVNIPGVKAGQPVQTVVAGMCLALALTGGGLWIARRATKTAPRNS
jgi:hypothetical protein